MSDTSNNDFKKPPLVVQGIQAADRGLGDIGSWIDKITDAQSGRAITGGLMKDAGTDIAKGFDPNAGQTPAPPAAPTTTSHTPATLSYQAAIAKAISPMIQAMGGLGNTSSINKYLSGTPESAAGSAAEPNLASGVATMLHNSISDYQKGLTAMMNSAGSAGPLQDILKGMGELLSYPTTGLTGTEGAPPGVSGNNVLTVLYNTLNNMRNGGSLPTTTGDANSGYNQSAASIVAGS